VEEVVKMEEAVNMSAQPLTRRVVITHPHGLHARPSLAIVNTVRRFRSKVTIQRDYQVVDAGEILQVLTLGATCGTELLLTAQGPDAAEALEALAQLFAANFGLSPDD
jgi:phosphotransferase system HPr (HPr) family protein